MYLKNGLAEREVGGRDRQRQGEERNNSEDDGEGKRTGRTHFRASAYPSQQSLQVHKGKKFGSLRRAF